MKGVHVKAVEAAFNQKVLVRTMSMVINDATSNFAKVHVVPMQCFRRRLVRPNEICVVQQGIRFSVAVRGPTRG